MTTNNFFVDIIDATDKEETVRECYNHYCNNADCGLNLKAFGELAKSLLCDSNGKSYEIAPRMLADMFYVFDLNKDGRIDFDEFLLMWNQWIKVVLKPISALVIIDVQNDFIHGTLSIKNCPAGHNGEDVIPVINSLIENVPFNEIVYSLDWHPEDHVSFIENVQKRKLDFNSTIRGEEPQVYDTVIFEGPPKIEQKLWPKHCVQNTWGAQLHEDLKVVNNAVFVYKGINSDIDSYSAFWDNQKLSATELDKELRIKGVTDVYICGLAYDFCVGSTALHALELGYRTLLIHDASRGVDDDTISDMQEKLISNNGIIVTSDKVKNMVDGKDRRPEFGYRTAMLIAAQKNN